MTDLDEAGTSSDREALRWLSTAYAAAVDDRDGARFAALFIESGELLVPDLPGDLRPVIRRAGHAALRRVPEGLRRYERTFHLVSNHRFSIDGQRAAGEVQCVAHHVMAAGQGTAGRTGTDTVAFRPAGSAPPVGRGTSRVGAPDGLDHRQLLTVPSGQGVGTSCGGGGPA